MFSPSSPPKDSEWAYREFVRLRDALNEFELLKLAQTNVAPTKPRRGEIRLADGTNWNPGSGEGLYAYYASAWHKIG